MLQISQKRPCSSTMFVICRLHHFLFPRSLTQTVSQSWHDNTEHPKGRTCFLVLLRATALWKPSSFYDPQQGNGWEIDTLITSTCPASCYRSAPKFLNMFQMKCHTRGFGRWLFSMRLSGCRKYQSSITSVVSPIHIPLTEPKWIQ